MSLPGPGGAPVAEARRAAAVLARAPAGPMPRRVAPMLAKPDALPRDEDAWGFEVKWDGIRALVYAERGRLRIDSRNLRDITHQYPEVHAVARDLGDDAVLDGEIVAMDERGRPSFQLLQARMGIGTEGEARRRVRGIPVIYMVFDLLHIGGRDLMGLPYAERREALEALALDGPAWTVPMYHRGDGAALLDATRAQGLEGLVAKRLDAPYEPGRRSGAWVKVRHLTRQEFVIAGWTAGEGGRSGRIGALVVGYYDGDVLRYAGKVGTGYTEAMLDRLGAMLAPLRRATSPFAGPQPPRGTVFVEPRLVAEVAFAEWTREGTLRQPSFQGLRPDKDAHEVVREDATASGTRKEET